MCRSARSINVCERTDGLWGLPPEVMCRVQRGKTWSSGQRGCILSPCQGQNGNPGSNDPLGSFDPSLTFEINCAAAVETARLAKSVGVSRFVFASSCSIYGAAGGELIDETASMNPVTPYGRSKLMAEEELADLADEKFSPVYVRSATAYGMSPKIRFDLVINNLAAWASTTGEVHLKSDGAAWRPCVHVEDLSRA